MGPGWADELPRGRESVTALDWRSRSEQADSSVEPNHQEQGSEEGWRGGRKGLLIQEAVDHGGAPGRGGVHGQDGPLRDVLTWRTLNGQRIGFVSLPLWSSR